MREAVDDEVLLMQKRAGKWFWTDSSESPSALRGAATFAYPQAIPFALAIATRLPSGTTEEYHTARDQEGAREWKQKAPLSRLSKLSRCNMI